MKKYLYIIGAMLLSSCHDSLEEPVLDVEFAPETYVEDGVAVVKPNEVVTFNISGAMDLLYYYSGKVGSRYKFEDNREGGDLTLYFKSNFGKGSGQHSNLSLWISHDFNDKIDIESFNSATWTQIDIPYTKKPYPGDDNKGGFYDYGLGGFPLPAVKPGKTFASPWINLLDYLPDDAEKFHLAFKYHTESPEDEYGNVQGKQWTINWFDVRREYTNGGHAYYGLYSPVLTQDDHRGDLRYVGFRSLSIPREESYADSLTWDTGRNALIFRPSYAPDHPDNLGHNLYYETDYAISREFIVNPDPEPEYATVLKMNTSDVPSEASVSYETPGEYTVTFIAKNANIDNSLEIIRELKVRVVDETAGE